VAAQPAATPNQKSNRRSRKVSMKSITKFVIQVREYGRGQTMAEYALILAAVAVVVFVGYQTMGTTITTLLGSVDGSL
jgi:Flp pilus assembly pilin Flp